MPKKTKSEIITPPDDGKRRLFQNLIRPFDQTDPSLLDPRTVEGLNRRFATDASKTQINMDATHPRAIRAIKAYTQLREIDMEVSKAIRGLSHAAGNTLVENLQDAMACLANLTHDEEIPLDIEPFKEMRETVKTYDKNCPPEGKPVSARIKSVIANLEKEELLVGMPEELPAVGKKSSAATKTAGRKKPGPAKPARRR